MAGGDEAAPIRLKVDRGIPTDLSRVPDTARLLERQRYDGCWTGEIDHDPFFPLLLAAEHTSRLEIGSSIAVAFARNPMTVANVGWDLQAYSQGRFNLGLGSQIQPHIERRFSMPWSHPVRRMHEFIEATRAIWTCWQDGGRLSFEGDFYTHTLMTPMFTPTRLATEFPRIFVAAVGEAMTRLCGEVADGVIAHAFTTKRYADEVTTPALEAGLTKAGRRRADVEVSCPVFIVTGETEESMAASAVGVRKQLAFYGSTPAYRGVLDLHGWGDLHVDLHALSKQGRWNEMGDLFDDEALTEFAVVAPVAELGAALRRRCAGAIDRVLPAFPADLPEDVVAAVIDEVRGG